MASGQMYNKPLQDVYGAYMVSEKAKQRIKSIHGNMQKKSMTSSGKDYQENFFQGKCNKVDYSRLI